MIRLIPKLPRWRKPTAHDYNKLVDCVQSLQKMRFTGANVRTLNGPDGVHVTIGGNGSGTELKIWRIKSTTTVDANGDANNYYAYYTCQPCTIDATYYNLSNTDPVAYAGDDVIVFLLWEAGEVSAANLIAGDYLVGYTTKDDEGNAINVAIGTKYAWVV